MKNVFLMVLNNSREKKCFYIFQFLLLATTKFQAFEIDHIEKMLALSLNYSDILQRTNDQIRSAQNDFNEKLKLLTGNELLDAFVEQRKTGTDRPGINNHLLFLINNKMFLLFKAALQFEEVDHHKTLTEMPSTQDTSNQPSQFETNLPSFQAHFSVQSPPVKHTDNIRSKLNT